MGLMLECLGNINKIQVNLSLNEITGYKIDNVPFNTYFKENKQLQYLSIN